MKRILIVDDETSILQVLACVLRHQGYDVATATSCEEGLDRLVDDEFDLAICDVRLGRGMDGLEFARTLRRLFNAPKVVLITAYGTAESFAQARGEGVADYILKPFNMDTIVSTVRRVLAQEVEA